MAFFNREPQQPIGESSSVEQHQSVPFMQTAGELGKLMLETNEENKSAYYSLLGLVEQDGRLVQVNEPLMNKKGAGHLLLLMHKLNNMGTFLTKLSDYDVVVATHRIWKNIIKLLIKNEEEWDLPDDRSRWSLIREIVVSPIYFALRRGENGLEKEFFRDTYESKTVSNQNTYQRYKGGFFG